LVDENTFVVIRGTAAQFIKSYLTNPNNNVEVPPQEFFVSVSNVESLRKFILKKRRNAFLLTDFYASFYPGRFSSSFVPLGRKWQP
jgi:hypothetical protein